MIEFDGSNVTMETLWQVACQNQTIGLSEKARDQVKQSRAFIERKLESGEAIYGVNTGFGALSEIKVDDSDIELLQRNLLRSHCCGVGPVFSEAQTRAIMFLRANALARGHSGVRPEVIDKIVEFLNDNVLPVIPQKGSVGASGDLAPLAHLALALTGEGEIWLRGEAHEAESVLQQKQIQPLKLKAKEGLSLINGCQVMTAVGLLNAYRSRRLAWMADLSGAMSLEALRGTRKAYHPIIPETRPHPGEAKTARNMLRILGENSPISQSHANCNKVQDAYSLRCIPAVHGAFKDSLGYCVQVLEREANSSTDNPLVFAQEELILSCGNFHGEPVAFVLDFLAIAVSGVASISECRIALLINPSMSGLAPFLAPKSGLNSGHMIVQVAAASLVSENKILAHPASVDSIPTSADKEDHVSMGTIAARKLGQIVDHGEQIVAMEMLSASQALDLLAPLKSSAGVQAAFEKIRETVPFASEDRVFAKDIQAIQSLIEKDILTQTVKEAVGELEW